MAIVAWALIAVAALMFITGTVGFIKPSALARPGKETPSRLTFLMSAWLGPVIPAAIGMVMLMPSSGPETIMLTKSDLKDPWPLSVDQVQLHCVEGSMLVLESNGKRYALNGSARSAAAKRDWAEVDAIWLANPELPGTKISASELIAKGHERCRAAGTWLVR